MMNKGRKERKDNKDFTVKMVKIGESVKTVKINRGWKPLISSVRAR
jgi:hypothetical protein